MAVINSIADREQEMKTWRHLLHQHPETSYEEVWTSDFIAEKLQSFGIEIHRGMGKTGIVGVLHRSGRAAQRAVRRLEFISIYNGISIVLPLSSLLI